MQQDNRAARRVARQEKQKRTGTREPPAQAKTLGPKVDPGHKEYTVVIYGAAPGGAFLAATVAQKLGLDFGNNVNKLLADDRFNGKSDSELRVVIGERNAASAAWGWKAAPGSDLRTVLPALRNPRLLFVSRDPVSFALAKGAPEDEFIKLVETAVAQQTGALDLLKSAGCPTLLLSYEDAIARPRHFISSIAAFIGKALPAALPPVVQLVKSLTKFGPRRGRRLGKGRNKPASKKR